MSPFGSTLNPIQRNALRARLLLFAAVVVGGLMTLLIAPALLIVVDGIYGRSDSWERLSNIGQSFTGMATLISSIALGVLAYQGRLQARNEKAAAIHAARSAQLQLISTALQDDELASVLRYSNNSEDGDRAAWRKQVYRNLWFMYLQMLFRTRELTESGLRRSLSGDVFNSVDAVAFWHGARSAFAESLTDTRGQVFLNIVDDEASKAVLRFAGGPMIQHRPVPKPDT